MKTLLVIATLLTMPLVSKAHDYYFSFVEMEYNAISQRIEMTLTLTTHDFERALEEKGNAIDNIASLGDEEIARIEKYVNSHFYVTSGEEKSRLKFIGNEVSLSGTSNWYFESEPIDFQDEITIRYDLLMDVFPEQQNKVTLYHKGETFTATFTPIDKTKQIYIENKEQ
ncbi:MAG: hypothetical protein NXI10_15830 [bacterium]|nr:hypothetical protein [bacterium]